MTVLQPGDTIDIWVIEAALGSGGMGSVYRCHNRAATRILAAVKVLEGGLKRYPEAEARFIREAEILFQLDHPNIVKVRNIRTDADPPYLEMEFVAGESLDERMRRGPLTFHETVQSMRQVAEALAYLHGKQIRHRDIKPANLLLQKDGRLKLVDFGLAVEADATRITQQGMAFGTVSYAPPEWITPEQLDPSKWDIYALGVVFYELLTGHLAFPVSGQGTARQQAMQVIVAKQDHPPLDPGDLFHDDIRALIADMTCADANKRIGEASVVVERILALNPSLKRSTGVTLAPTPGSSLLFGGGPDGMDTHPFLTAPVTQKAVAADRARAVPVIAATTPVTMPVPARFGTMAIAFGGASAVALAALILGGGGVLLGLGWFMTRPPPVAPTRDVVVEVSGLPDGATADVVSSAGDPVRDGDRYTFAQIAPGLVDVRWAVGDGCTVASCDAPEGCGAWCQTGAAQVEVPAGTEPLVAPLEVVAPLPRDVRFGLTGLTADDRPSRATLGATVGTSDAAGLLFSAVQPGRYRMELVVGTCPDTALGCGADCPPGCRSVVVEPVVVPIVGDPTPPSLEVTPPERVAVVAPPPAPSSVRPKGALVTKKAISSWIEAHPEWAPGARFAGGDRYLSWWSAPDRATSGAPATHFTPKLADAFCRDQGGRVPPTDAEPRVPPDGRFELRLAENKFVLLEPVEDGGVRTLPAEANGVLTSIAVFRCVK